MGEVLPAQGQEMSAIKSNLAALSTQMAAMMAEAKKNRVSGYRASSQSPSHRRGDKQGCYHCGVMGHFKGGCPSLGSPKGRNEYLFSIIRRL